MKVLIIDGNTGFDSKYEEYLKSFILENETSGNEVNVFTLRDLNLDYCTGCWSCWVKTPGQCIFPDDTDLVRKEMINSQLVIFVSPLIMGYPTYLIKMVQDKMIPLVHPYIEIINGECHHESRYKKYPQLGLLYYPESNTDDDDLNIIHDLYKRLAINFKSEMVMFENLKEIEIIKNINNEATVN